jgi:hypothetical protein
MALVQQRARDAVVLSADLVPLVMAPLALRDHAAAAVCLLWRALWDEKTRRILRRAPASLVTSPLLTGSSSVQALAANETGTRMAIACGMVNHGQVIRIVNEMMEEMHVISDPSVSAMTFGTDWLYTVSQYQLRRYEVGSYALKQTVDPSVEPHELDGDDSDEEMECIFCSGMAQGPAGLFVSMMHYAGSNNPDDEGWIRVFHPDTLKKRFDVCRGFVTDGHEYAGLLIHGNELYVTPYGRGAAIQVLSLDGEPRRSIPAPWSGEPYRMCFVHGRVYVLESRESGHASGTMSEDGLACGWRITVVSAADFSPLYVYEHPKPYGGKGCIEAMCYFAGYLYLGEGRYRDDYWPLFAMQGL